MVMMNVFNPSFSSPYLTKNKRGYCNEQQPLEDKQTINEQKIKSLLRQVELTNVLINSMTPCVDIALSNADHR
jgi:hypothetical protein